MCCRWLAGINRNRVVNLTRSDRAVVRNARSSDLRHE
jgi:hypothetical protein